MSDLQDIVPSVNINTALRIVTAGFPVFPVNPTTKRPYSNADVAEVLGIPAPLPGLGGFKLNTRDPLTVQRLWQRFPDALPAMPTGALSGIDVLDIDVKNGKNGWQTLDLLGLRETLRDAPWQQTMSGGTHYLFRHDPDHSLYSCSDIFGKDCGVDIRGNNGLIVIYNAAPFERDGFPAVPEWLHMVIRSSEAGGMRKPLGEPSMAAPSYDKLLQVLQSIDPNQLAYDEWLSITAAFKQAASSLVDDAVSQADYLTWCTQYEADDPRENASKWRSITDTQVGWLNLLDAVDNSVAASVLFNGMTYDLPVGCSQHAGTHHQNGNGEIVDNHTGQIIQLPDLSTVPTATNVPYPPGLVGDIAKWMTACALRPQPALAIGAALAIVGTAGARLFTTPVMDGSLALYVLGLAPTGTGKEAAMHVGMRLMAAADLEKHLGPNELVSDVAVGNRVAKMPLCLCFMDEFGDTLRKVYAKHAHPSARAVLKEFRTLWGNNNGVYRTSEAATREAHMIEAPALSMFAASTHEQFYSAIEGGAVHDGTLNRFLILEGSQKPDRNYAALDSKQVPNALSDCLKRIYRHGGLQATALRNSPERLGYDLVPLTWGSVEAHQAYMALAEQMEDESNDLLVRTAEMAVRIASIVAIGRLSLTVSADDFAYGQELALQSARLMQRGTEERMADTEHGRNVNEVLRYIREQRKTTRRDVSRKFRGLDKRKRNEILEQLVEEDAIAIYEVQTGRRPTFEIVPR